MSLAVLSRSLGVALISDESVIGVHPSDGILRLEGKSMRGSWPIVIGLMALCCSCGPRTYEDCLLDHAKAVTGGEAYVLVTRACRQKFPEKTPPDYELKLSSKNIW
jgi:hypothetical protein